jgi:hypothetical protein
VNLGLEPRQILAHLPADPAAADYRWLLERLAAGDRIRINCGKDEVEDREGNIWADDCFHRGGKSYRTTAPTVPPLDAGLGRSVRAFSGDDLHAGYHLPLPRGSYRVALHLGFFLAVDPARLQVSLEGEVRQARVDRAADEHLKGERRAFEDVEVNDGILDIELVRQDTDAYILAIEIDRVR